MNAIRKHMGKRKKRTPPRRKVFVSFHIADRRWKDEFSKLMKDFVEDRSVNEGDVEADGRDMDDILRQIREKHIADSTVAVVLIGHCTWRRRFIDWEIHASLRCTSANPRLGLVGIVLPNHPNHGASRNPRLMPPRLADNIGGKQPFARVYDWPDQFDPKLVASWINRAFGERNRKDPCNSRELFANNRKRPCAKGWQ